MTPQDRMRWHERLRRVTPIDVTDKYPGNPDYISTKDFVEMVDVLVAAVAEEREACAKIAEEVVVDWSRFDAHPDPDPAFEGEFVSHDDNTCRHCIAAAIRGRAR